MHMTWIDSIQANAKCQRVHACNRSMPGFYNVHVTPIISGSTLQRHTSMQTNSLNCRYHLRKPVSKSWHFYGSVKIAHDAELCIICVTWSQSRVADIKRDATFRTVLPWTQTTVLPRISGALAPSESVYCMTLFSYFMCLVCLYGWLCNKCSFIHSFINNDCSRFILASAVLVGCVEQRYNVGLWPACELPCSALDL